MINLPSAKKPPVLTYGILAGDFIKVGKSRDVNSRQSAVQTGCPFKGRLLFTTDSPEKRLHRMLKQFRSGGGSEWFHFSDGLIDILADQVWSRKHTWHFKWDDLWELKVCDASQLRVMRGCFGGEKFKWKTADGDILIMRSRPNTYAGYLCSCFAGALELMDPDGVIIRPRPILRAAESA